MNWEQFIFGYKSLFYLYFFIFKSLPSLILASLARKLEAMIMTKVKDFYSKCRSPICKLMVSEKTTQKSCDDICIDFQTVNGLCFSDPCFQILLNCSVDWPVSSKIFTPKCFSWVLFASNICTVIGWQYHPIVKPFP